MARGRKKKYVRPTIECKCDTCSTELTQPYIHIKLKSSGLITHTPIVEGTKNRDLPGSQTGYYCNVACYNESLV
jgi:hypothetical protein